ncbi:hypothetical protein TNCT_519781 [Trichonephila clavata]|uniref:Uncharacterized protein n=1 Tax=Trichonephila clavata TaxID=2740835 RepID=A0A8X6J866_TRICU|nr:hypothetical protein TNCT_519781 [Trichonephila clavata]
MKETTVAWQDSAADKPLSLRSLTRVMSPADVSFKCSYDSHRKRMLLSWPQMSQGASRSANYRQRLVFIDDSDDCHYNQIKAQTTAFALQGDKKEIGKFNSLSDIERFN